MLAGKKDLDHVLRVTLSLSPFEMVLTVISPNGQILTYQGLRKGIGVHFTETLPSLHQACAAELWAIMVQQFTKQCGLLVTKTEQRTATYSSGNTNYYVPVMASLAHLNAVRAYMDFIMIDAGIDSVMIETQKGPCHFYKLGTNELDFKAEHWVLTAHGNIFGDKCPKI